MGSIFGGLLVRVSESFGLDFRRLWARNSEAMGSNFGGYRLEFRTLWTRSSDVVGSNFGRCELEFILCILDCYSL